MEVDIRADALYGALHRIWPAAQDWDANGIKHAVTCVARNGEIRFIAGGVALYAESTPLAATVKAEGGVMLQGDKLRQIASEHNEGDELHWKLDEQRLIIAGPRVTFNLLYGEPLEQNILGDVKWVYEMSLDRFREMVSKVIPAVGSDHSTYTLQSVLIKRFDEDDEDACIRAVATDGHRLHLAEIRDADILQGVSMEGNLYEKLDSGILLNPGVFKFIEGWADDKSITVGFPSEDWIAFKIEPLLFAVRLSAGIGEYPDYESLFEPLLKPGCEVSADCEELARAIRAASVVVAEKQKCVSLKIHDNKISVEAEDNAGSKSSIEVPASVKGKARPTVKLRGKFVNDVLSAMPESERAELVLADNSFTQVGFRQPPKDKSDTKIFRCLVMPVR